MSVGIRDARGGRWSSLQKVILAAAVAASAIIAGAAVYYVAPRPSPAGAPASPWTTLFQTQASNVSGNWTTHFVDHRNATDFQMLMVWIQVQNVSNLTCANGIPYTVICSYWLNNTTSGWPTSIGGWEDAPGVSSVGGRITPGNLTLQVRVDYCYYWSSSTTCGPLQFNLTARMIATDHASALN